MTETVVGLGEIGVDTGDVDFVSDEEELVISSVWVAVYRHRISSTGT